MRLILVFLIISTFVIAAPKSLKKRSDFVGISYLNITFGHVHENPNDLSASLTTIACGYPVKIFAKAGLEKSDWKYVKIGGDFGYVREKFLDSTKPACLQAKYPKFFNNLNLDLSEMYYWGRLHDQLLMETTHVR